MLTRRHFLGTTAAVGAGTLAARWNPALGAAQDAAATPASAPREKILVVVQLSGGNDGLNTVVPYADETYLKARPKLKYEKQDVLVLDERTGLHPSLKALRARYERGQLAIVQSVGYPGANRSHFRSMEIWHTAEPTETVARTGWLGRAVEELGPGEAATANVAPALNLGNTLPFALQRAQGSVLSFENEDSFELAADRRYQQGRAAQLAAFKQLCQAPAPAGTAVARVRAVTAASLGSAQHVLDRLHSGRNQSNYGRGLAARLGTIARLIDGGLAARVYYTSAGGYDTHARQKDAHANLLRALSEGLEAFLADLEQSGRAEDVVVLVFSEFGRRVAENGSQGTDHGTSGPVFVLGPRVRGGLYGSAPDLSAGPERDPPFKTDFRAVYASLLEGWLGLPAERVVGPGHAPLALFA